MYKLLLFLNKTDDGQVINHFKEYTVKFLSDLCNEEIKIGSVESNLLLDQKFLYFCEVMVDSKEKWDELMNSKEGRTLSKDLMEFHQFVTAIFIDYNK